MWEREEGSCGAESAQAILADFQFHPSEPAVSYYMIQQEIFTFASKNEISKNKVILCPM